jgi:hypothetical protein
MGAWNPTSFGNDSANDWAYALESSDGLPYIEEALQAVLHAGEDYVDAGDAEEAIGAAEVLAWMKGKPSAENAFTEKVARWVRANPNPPPPSLVLKALAVLDRVLQSPSELLELWEGEPAWNASVEDLRARLKS